MNNKDAHINTRAPLCSHSRNIWDLLWAKHTVPGAWIQQWTKRQRFRADKSIIVLKSLGKKQNPDQAQKIMKKKYLLLVHLSVSSSHFPIATCKQTRLLVIPAMKHSNFKFLRKKLFAPNVNTWLFDKNSTELYSNKERFICMSVSFTDILLLLSE